MPGATRARGGNQGRMERRTSELQGRRTSGTSGTSATLIPDERSVQPRSSLGFNSLDQAQNTGRRHAHVTRSVSTKSRVPKSRQVEHYNLDVIISVGFRVKSAQGTRFRQWATRVVMGIDWAGMGKSTWATVPRKLPLTSLFPLAPLGEARMRAKMRGRTPVTPSVTRMW